MSSPAVSLNRKLSVVDKLVLMVGDFLTNKVLSPRSTAAAKVNADASEEPTLVPLGLIFPSDLHHYYEDE